MHTQRTIMYIKRKDPLREDIETETIHHHPENTDCDCCHQHMVAIGSTLAREEAAFIPAKMVHVQHIEHAYEFRKLQRRHLTACANQTREGTQSSNPTQSGKSKRPRQSHL